jgi:cell division protein FtsB
LARDYNNLNDYNNRRNVNANNRPSNRAGMTLSCAPRTFAFMKTYRHLFDKLTDYSNLLLAFQKARKRNAKKPYVIEFEKNLRNESQDSYPVLS